MSNERTRFITIRLDAPEAGASTSRSCVSAGDDDLAAVLRWLGEASAAGWCVTAHIPQARIALVVSTGADGESSSDKLDNDEPAAAPEYGFNETDLPDDKTDTDSDSDDDGVDADDYEAALSAPVGASRKKPQVRFASRPVVPPPRLRSPVRRIGGAARRWVA